MCVPLLSDGLKVGFSTHNIANFCEDISSDISNSIVSQIVSLPWASYGMFNAEFLATHALRWKECRLPSIAQAESITETPLVESMTYSSMWTVESQVDVPFFDKFVCEWSYVMLCVLYITFPM